MICEKTRKALEQLIPEMRIQGAVLAEDNEQEEVSEKTPKKPAPEPRLNGVLERDYAVHGYHLDAQVDSDQLLLAIKIIDENQFFIEAITGVDWIKDDQIEVIYDFSRYDFDVCRVVVRTRVPRDSAVLPSITDIYAGANWHERETAEFFGITFSGHPHLIPLLLPEDADFHPLRKDYKP